MTKEQQKLSYLLWKSNSWGVMYLLPHPGQACGPIPVCRFMCICKERFVLNCFGHSEHWYKPVCHTREWIFLNIFFGSVLFQP